jgi:sulfur carrier protein
LGAVLVNGEPHELVDGTTVADVVARCCDRTDGIAVARNRDVVPKSEWVVTTVGEGDRIEIVTAAAGG